MQRNTRFFWGALIAYLVMGAYLTFPMPGSPARDDSDGRTRSGMGVHTDCLTGLQYLSSPRGGLTPRLGADGKQIMNKEGCHAGS